MRSASQPSFLTTATTTTSNDHSPFLTMPQYASTGLLGKDYWKGIDRSTLSLNTLSNITGFPRASLKAWRTETSSCGLNYICLRQDANLLVYETCSDAELRGFAREKKIEVSQGVRRAELIKLLQDKETFHGFLDLPPEMRNEIYQHYFDSNPHCYDGFRVPPPITQASRQLRKESLSEFWKQSFRFSINTIQYNRWGAYRMPGLGGDNVFADVPDDCVKFVRKLLVDVDDEEELLELDLATKGTLGKLTRLVGKESKIDERLLEFLETVSQRTEAEGGSLLQKGDEKRILRMFY